MNFYQRILGVVYSDLSPMRWIMGWISLVLAAGFFFSDTDNHNYDLINIMAQKNVWGFLYTIHGISMLYTALYPRCDYYLKSMFSIIGIWLWSYVFLSFTFYDPTPVKATEWMLFLPVMVEVWLLSESGVRRFRK
jgi:hypothetical protein